MWQHRSPRPQRSGPSLASLLEHFEQYPYEDYTLNFCQNANLCPKKQQNNPYTHNQYHQQQISSNNSGKQYKTENISSPMHNIININHYPPNKTNEKQQVKDRKDTPLSPNVGSVVKAKIQGKNANNQVRKLNYGDNDDIQQNKVEVKKQAEKPTFKHIEKKEQKRNKKNEIIEKVEEADRNMTEQFKGFSNKISQAKAQIAQYLKAYSERRQNRQYPTKKQQILSKIPSSNFSNRVKCSQLASQNSEYELQIESKLQSQKNQKNKSNKISDLYPEPSYESSPQENIGAQYSFAQNICGNQQRDKTQESCENRVHFAQYKANYLVPDVIQIVSEQYLSKASNQHISMDSQHYYNKKNYDIISDLPKVSKVEEDNENNDQTQTINFDLQIQID